MENPLKKKQMVEFEFEFSQSTEKPENPEFSYGKAKVLYKGLNRNNSYLTDTSVKNALPTLFGIPIVGEYDESTDNFKGHGGKVVMTDDGVEYIDTTVPFGYVSENANTYWETIEETNGTKRDYFVVDKCVFWTGRYPQLNTLLKNGKFNQSMEIKVNDGSFAIIDGEESFRVDNFTFSALCILGIATEEDPYGHVEPCFESASIEIYENNKFQLKFNQMIGEFNKGNLEGGQIVADVTMTNETEEVKEEAENSGDVEEFGKTQVTEVESENSETITTIVELDENDNPIEDTKQVITEKTEVVSVTEHVIDESTDNIKNEDDMFNRTEEEFSILETTITNHEATIKDLTAKNGVLTEQFKLQSNELEELRTFKRQTEINEVVEKFSGKLEDDILKSTIEKHADKSVEELEGLIFAEIGKQNFSVKEKKEKEPVSIPVVQKEEKEEKVLYNGLFTMYGKSN